MIEPAPPGSLEWIDATRTPFGRSVDVAIPPVFAAYAVLDTAIDGWFDAEVEDPLLERVLVPLRAWTTGRIVAGYLCWGESAPEHLSVPATCDQTAYWGWQYTVIVAELDEAIAARQGDRFRGALPDILFPADRSWLLSHLWDDGWVHAGGSEAFVDGLVDAGDGHVRRVRPGEDATPPGREGLE